MGKIEKVSFFDIFVVFMLVGIVPFIVYGTFYTLPLSSTEGTSMFDYFNYNKVVIIKLVALLIVLEGIANMLISGSKFITSFEEIKKIDKKILFTALIVLSTVIAYIFSDYKYIANFGAPERFESIWVHFSYVVIFIYSLKFFKKQGSFEILSYAVLLAAFVVGGIGTLQYLGVDVFSSGIMKELTYKEIDIQIVSPGSFTTMYNINTSASYSLLMMFIVAIIIVLNNNKVVKAMGVIGFVLLGITFYNSMSEASYIAAASGVVFVGFIYALSVIVNGDKNKIKYLTYGIATIAVCFIVLLATTGITNKALDLITPEITFVKWQQDNNELYFYNKNDDYIKIVTAENAYEVFENEKLILEGGDGEEGVTKVETENFGSLNFEYVLNENGGSGLRLDWYCIVELVDDEPNVIDATTGEVNVTADYIGFENYPNTMTNRGYIWSRSIPILFDNLFTGIGSDVYYEIFPNDDKVVQSFMKVSNVHVDKPHSIYLNMAINNGILYLLGFIAIVFAVAIEKLKVLFTEGLKIQYRLALSLYIAGVFAYLVNGLATDNLVVIVMLFWVYLALSEYLIVRDEFVKTSTYKTNKSEKIEKVQEPKAKEVEVIVEETESVDTEKDSETDNTIDYSEIGVSYKDLVSKDNELK